MDLKLGSDGDLDISANDFVLVDGIDAIKQAVSMRLQTFYGEIFSHATRGVPWFTEILIKNPGFLIIGEILKKTILETDGVTDITKFIFDLSDRVATLDFEGLTENGFIDFSQKVEL